MRLIGTEETSGVILPEGTSFDGSTDYLSRSSDLVGNADGKTFTFSCWVYCIESASISYCFTVSNPAGNKFVFQRNTDGTFRVIAKNTSGVNVLNVLSSLEIPLYTYSNIILSVDLTSTGNRTLYVNDVVDSSATYSVYTNDNINFTYGELRVGNLSDALYFKGRLAHMFLDYTYRDLSIEANRRLFITEDLKPADGQAALNPILYLPMTDKETAHINEGTGGDFVQNGVLDDAQRGPNQDNCVASEFDGTDDYLSSASIGAAAGKQFVFSTTYEMLADRNGQFLYIRDTGLGIQLYASTGNLTIIGRTAANDAILFISITAALKALTNGSVQVSLDMDDIGSVCIIIDGVDRTADATISPFVPGGILDFTKSVINIGSSNNSTANCRNYSAGQLYFDTNYIDLATDNPFWDADNNRPKPVRQVLEETGNTPLIAMPISADDPGKNLGTGGDFTVNGGGLVGARGGSEFWARSAHVSDTGTTNKLVLTSPISSGNTITGCVAIKNLDSNANSAVFGFDATGGLNLRYNGSGNLTLYKGTTTIITITSQTFSTGWAVIYFTLDITGTNNYLRNSNNQVSTTTVNAYEATSVNSLDMFLLSRRSNNYTNSDLGSFYFTTDYIDFSDESNRNLFIDQLGYPKDLSKHIIDGVWDETFIPEPLIYMPFDEPDNLGKNLGTGGDFTVNGTVTPGSDVDPNA